MRKRRTPDFTSMRRATPARLAVGRAGPRYTTDSWLRLRADHARAVDAVITEVSPAWVKRNHLHKLRSRAESREQFLLSPEAGRRLCTESMALLRRLCPRRSLSNRATVLLCVGDGLSSAAVEANAGALLAALIVRLGRRYRLLPPLFIRNARVRVQDHIGELVRPDLICMLVGERPGLATAESLSAYVIYRPRLKSLEPDRTVISNIHRGGLTVPQATSKLAVLIDDTLRHRASGAALAHQLGGEQ